jgi:hypothetical protein
MAQVVWMLATKRMKMHQCNRRAIEDSVDKDVLYVNNAYLAKGMRIP